MVASDLYGIVLGFGIASLGFGFTRPGFTGGASLAVPLGEQGGVAGVVTAANGISFVAAPGIGMLLYAIDPALAVRGRGAARCSACCYGAAGGSARPRPCRAALCRASRAEACRAGRSRSRRPASPRRDFSVSWIWA